MESKLKNVGYAVLLPILITIYMVTVSLASTPFYYTLPNKILLVLLYGFFVGSLYYFTLVLNKLARLLGFLGGLAIGMVLTWHLREQFLIPYTKTSFIGGLTALALLYFIALQLIATNLSPWRLLIRAVSLMIAFIVLLISSLYLSEGFRWHVLRHNTILGTPAYYLLMPSVLDVQSSMSDKYKKLSPSNFEVKTISSRIKSDVIVNDSKENQPDIIFILIDTLRADVIKQYGRNPPLMPYLDQLADQSIVFRDVIANSSWTRPSVASFFTGLIPEEHGARDRAETLSSQYQTLAEELHTMDYQTVAFITNGAVGRQAGFNQGFDHFFELEGNPYVRARDVVDSVFDWLSGGQRIESKRLFLYIHFLDPHMPYLSGGEQRWSLPTLSAYNQELLYVDGALENLISGLKKKLSRPSLILITSDHGEEFGEHDIYEHGYSLYEEVLRIPLILHSSDHAPGVILHDKLEARDFFDLVVQLAKEENFSITLWSQLQSRRTRYASLYNFTDHSLARPYLSHVSMRRVDVDDNVLIWSGYGNTYELYDVKDDPGLMHNLVDSEPELVRELTGVMDRQPRFWLFPEPYSPSQKDLEQLKALGYIQ